MIGEKGSFLTTTNWDVIVGSGEEPVVHLGGTEGRTVYVINRVDCTLKKE